jgi:hypothetical protein
VKATQKARDVTQHIQPQPAAPFTRYAVVTVLVLIPCFWQSRIQAGDLSSHIYNAWLVQLIGSGRAPGLGIAFQSTNVLFDWLLTGLLPLFGAAATQRIAVAAAVLIFVWGAFAFIRALAGRAPWHLMPVIAMLAYGWVFHSGFFNFYLSLGLCWWAMAIAWHPTRPRIGAALAVLALAWMGHNLPVLWSVGILGYVWTAGRLNAAGRARLLAACLAGLVLLHVAVRLTMLSQWYSWQALLASGADQAHVFDDKYYLAAAGIFLIFALLFIDLAARSGLRALFAGIPFQVFLLSAAIVAIIPTAMIGGGLQAAFVSDRMSLPAGICLCALLAATPAGRLKGFLIAAVAVLFFGLLYRDERLLNALEDRLGQAVAQAPPDSRIVSAVDDPDLHVNALTHMIDRVCIARCFSYANYEASTGQFRIRVRGESPIVASTYEDSWRMQNGSYLVKERDLPLYAVTLDEAGNLTLQSLRAGERIGSRYRKALPPWYPWI